MFGNGRFCSPRSVQSEKRMHAGVSCTILGRRNIVNFTYYIWLRLRYEEMSAFLAALDLEELLEFQYTTLAAQVSLRSVS